MIYQGIEYQVRASLGRDEWVLLIYFPDKPDGKATVSKFTGTRAEVAGAARRKIDNWLSEQKRKAKLSFRSTRTQRVIASTRFSAVALNCVGG